MGSITLALPLAVVLGLIVWVVAWNNKLEREAQQQQEADKRLEEERKQAARIAMIRAAEAARIAMIRAAEAARIAMVAAAEAAHIARQQAEEAARMELHTRTQDGYYQQMITLADQSLTLFATIPGHVNSAEVYLDQAEADFREGVFAPFWDSVENAVRSLGQFDYSVRKIDGNLSQHTDLVKQYEAKAPVFPMALRSVTSLAVGSATAQRMKNIVRTAQSNFQFALIYEQRKTNQILGAGFATLGQALEQMTWKLQASIHGLSDTVEASGRAISDRVEAAGLAISDRVEAAGLAINDSVLGVNSRMDEMAMETERHREAAAGAAAERTQREEKVVEMLDNIQRGRRPIV